MTHHYICLLDTMSVTEYKVSFQICYMAKKHVFHVSSAKKHVFLLKSYCYKNQMKGLNSSTKIYKLYTFRLEL